MGVLFFKPIEKLVVIKWRLKSVEVVSQVLIFVCGFVTEMCITRYFIAKSQLDFLAKVKNSVPCDPVLSPRPIKRCFRRLIAEVHTTITPADVKIFWYFVYILEKSKTIPVTIAWVLKRLRKHLISRKDGLLELTNSVFLMDSVGIFIVVAALSFIAHCFYC